MPDIRMQMMLAKRGLRSDRLWTIGFIYRSFLRYIPLALDTLVLMRSQYWPRARLDRLQEERLWQVFKNVQVIPQWKATLERTFSSSDIASLSPREALARMPILSKKDLIALGDRAVDTSLVQKSETDQTSGSTGQPLHFFQDRGAILRSAAIVERTLRVMSKKRYPVVYLRAKERYGFTFFRHAWFYVANFSNIKYRTADVKQCCDRLRGAIVYGYTSWIVELARQMKKQGITAPVRAVAMTGEHLAPEDRRFLENTMNAPVFTVYASREAGFLAFECEHHAMHLNEEWAYIEIVGGNGERLPAGKEGRILVTTFDNRVMPLVRYEIGDSGCIGKDPCRCGRMLRTLTFKGRTSELIELEDDRTVSLLDIAYSIGSYRDAILDYQIVQNGKMSFIFKVVAGAKFSDRKEALEEYLIRLLHPRAVIRWEVVNSIPRAASGKAAYFIRDLKKI